jgi:hypothetical protein
MRGAGRPPRREIGFADREGGFADRERDRGRDSVDEHAIVE